MKFLKKIIYRILFYILNIIEKIIPKNDTILFFSDPDYSDNSYAVFKYLLKKTNKKIIWLYGSENIEKKIFDEFGIKINCYKVRSIRGILNYIRSKISFCTTGLYPFINKKNQINLWHGMPLKNIGAMNKVYNGKIIKTRDNLIATSKVFKEIMMECFAVDQTKVAITGLPRNDLLFEETKIYKKLKINKESFKKIIMYLPTYRKSIYETWCESGIFDENRIGIISLDRLSSLNEQLSKNNNLMFIKLHPADILQNLTFENFSNIIILKSKDLEKINEQLYPLLGSSDLLITDYSSVWIDYEILGKPIYFAMEDYEEYKNDRGFTIENLPTILPGDIITTFDDFLKKLENIPNKIQKETGDTFNEYKDNNSTKRVLETFKVI